MMGCDACCSVFKMSIVNAADMEGGSVQMSSSTKVKGGDVTHFTYALARAWP
jgi:hypothetical protein